MKINDHVRILNEDLEWDSQDPNGVGRVVDIDDQYAYISNMNMPYMGTYSREPIPLARVDVASE